MAPLSSTHVPQVRIPATYIRGGTSKGVFFHLPDLPEVRQDLAHYYEAISRWDHCVGRVLGALEGSGRADDTLVVEVWRPIEAEVARVRPRRESGFLAVVA